MTKTIKQTTYGKKCIKTSDYHGSKRTSLRSNVEDCTITSKYKYRKFKCQSQTKCMEDIPEEVDSITFSDWNLEDKHPLCIIDENDKITDDINYFRYH